MNDHPSSRPVSAAARVPALHAFALVLLLAAGAPGSARSATAPAAVRVTLKEWKVEVSPARVPPGAVSFEIRNEGTIPHAFEVEGRGIEKSTPQLKPGTSTTFQVALPAGAYEVYCPVGKGSHEMLGMKSSLAVGTGSRARATGAVSRPAAGSRGASATRRPADADEHEEHEREEHEEHEHAVGAGSGSAEDPKGMRVTGGGTVVQILPGPFPFADSAMSVIHERPADQQADLLKKAHAGPYSNAVATIGGTISLLALDRGATRDSVSGTADFTTADGAHWKLVMDRVQTRDIPFNPRFGGVIMGLFYHGASGVHTPLVPTIQSSLALWAYAHLWRNDQLVTDDAMVHVMLLSRTRRTSDWALDCWDCSDRPIEELQLQVTPPPNAPGFEAPGGFLFVNWEKSSGQRLAL